MTVNKINDGQDANASVTLSSGVVTAITVTNGGTGYPSTPTVVIEDPKWNWCRSNSNSSCWTDNSNYSKPRW